MKWLKEIHLKDFRNFESLSIAFSPRINLIIGENGIGKTSLLEAVHMLSTGRSFKTNELKEAIRKGRAAFWIDAIYEDHGIEQRLRLSFDGKERLFKHNETLYKSFSPLLGILPSVIYAPSDITLIIGTPKDRRRFMNIELSQSDPLYVYYLTRYAKALLHRNTLLKQKKRLAIEIWEEELAKSGNYLIHKREDFFSELSKKVKEEYCALTHVNEEIEIHYHPSRITEGFSKIREREFAMGHTLLGPHRDDFSITLKGHDAKKYASEGQKRTLLSALKLATLSRFESPFFSIDDFGTHLDSDRQELLKNQLIEKDQTFLTTPHPIKLSHTHHIVDLGSRCISSPI